MTRAEAEEFTAGARPAEDELGTAVLRPESVVGVVDEIYGRTSSS